MIYTAIVFLPLIGALIAGLFGRVIGERPSEIVTTALLMISALLSWVVFVQVGIGHETHKVQVLRWITSGELDTSWSLRIDTLTYFSRRNRLARSGRLAAGHLRRRHREKTRGEWAHSIADPAALNGGRSAERRARR